MSVVAWACVGCALGVVFVRRRSTAIAFVTLQSLLLAGAAFAQVPHRAGEFLVASIALLIKALAVAALLLWTLRRTREAQPVVNDLSATARLAIAVAVALAIAATVPGFDSGAPGAEHAALAIVAIGIVVTALRHATLLQALGLLIAENGVATIAIAARGGVPLLIELGAVFDLVIVIAIATAFHERIFGEFGSGDATALKELRD